VTRFAAAVAERGRRPLTGAVERQDCGLFERRRKERAGGVRLVVIGKDVAAAMLSAQRAIEFALQVQLGLQPQRQRLLISRETRRRDGAERIDQPRELRARPVVERHVIEVGGGDAAFAQAIGDGILREMVIVLLAREPFFLRGGDNAPVAQQHCRESW
jgi:hypothetical protein